MTEELAAKLQAALALHDVADGGGMSATVMTAEGTWSGTTGTADGVRDLQVDDQFAIASITKSVVAAQVMLMVEAGELGLDDLVADHLPGDLQFDSNEATIRDLLGHRSGLPDYYDLPGQQSADRASAGLDADRDPGAVANLAESSRQHLLLRGDQLPAAQHGDRAPAGAPTRRRASGRALAIGGLERLVHQPDERPTEPMAMPAGASNAVLEIGGGYLPSLANSTAYQASGAIASDSPSLARWWRALCAGEIVSQASLTEMSTFEPAAHLGSYGLGVYNPADGYAEAFGHTGQMPGYMSWAACLPEDEAVIVVLTNHRRRFQSWRSTSPVLVVSIRRRAAFRQVGSCVCTTPAHQPTADSLPPAASRAPLRSPGSGRSWRPRRRRTPWRRCASCPRVKR